MTAQHLPPVTDAHRRAAFDGMRWAGWTYEAAMGNDMRRRIIEARAHQLRTRQWLATAQHSAATVRRCRLDAAGEVIAWLTEKRPGAFEPPPTDLLTSVQVAP